MLLSTTTHAPTAAVLLATTIAGLRLPQHWREGGAVPRTHAAQGSSVA